jgi:hypothetical protein
VSLPREAKRLLRGDPLVWWLDERLPREAKRLLSGGPVDSLGGAALDEGTRGAERGTSRYQKSSFAPNWIRRMVAPVARAVMLPNALEPNTAFGFAKFARLKAL